MNLETSKLTFTDFGIVPDLVTRQSENQLLASTALETKADGMVHLPRQLCI
jgi:hypothetical protein